MANYKGLDKNFHTALNSPCVIDPHEAIPSFALLPGS